MITSINQLRTDPELKMTFVQWLNFIENESFLNEVESIFTGLKL